MDFLARLIGGSGARRKTVASQQPQQRLIKFKRLYSKALQVSHKTQGVDTDDTLIDLIQAYLQRLINVLGDDTRAPAPHLCLSFAASSFVYTAISRIALSLDNEAITREAIALFTILVDSDEENLLATERFAETLMNFVDAVMGHHSYTTTSDIQSEALELIFGIAAKIRLEPELLPVWFRKSPSIENDKMESASQEEDFPLCHQFLSHVYHEGRAGDFARTGLLYILESASNSLALENWIAASDLPTLMASGLGALYSQLSRKVTVAQSKFHLPLALALSDIQDHEPSLEAESFLSLDLQNRLTTFLSHMIFWQDVLEHCHSPDIKHTLLDRFQVEFLQQILYPSLLESSDVDGGSSVAVLTYLYRLLDSVTHSDLIHLILHYLLALREPVQSQPDTLQSPTLQKPRRSLSNGPPISIVANPSFFNLADLILGSCKSANPATVAASLRLVTIILDKHHPYATSGLVRTVRKSKAGNYRSIGTFMHDEHALFTVAKELGGLGGIIEAYEAHVKDSLSMIEAHPCSVHLLRFKGLPSKDEASVKGTLVNKEACAMHLHAISIEDPLLKQLNELLQTFLTNDVGLNLALTSAISHLVCCPYVQMDGWLTSPHSARMGNEMTQHEADKHEYENVEDLDLDGLEEERINIYKRAKDCPSTWHSTSTPRLIASLLSLVGAIARLKDDIPEFQALLNGRDRAFQGAMEFHTDFCEASSLFSRTARTPLENSREASTSRAVPIPSLSLEQTSAQEVSSTSPLGRTVSFMASQGQPSVTASPRSIDLRYSPPLAIATLWPSGLSDELSASPAKPPEALKPTLQREGPSLLSNATLVPRTNPEKEHLFERRIRIFSSVTNHALVTGLQTSELIKADLDNEAEQTERRSDSERTTEAFEEVTLTHILTNVVLLRDFVLELAATMHVRAGLLDGEFIFV